MQGLASVGSIRRFVMAEMPDLPKMMLKKGVLKAVERGLIKQVKGKGFSGSFKVNILNPALMNYLMTCSSSIHLKIWLKPRPRTRQ